MDAMTCIMTRYSVRAYKNEAIDQRVITDLLRAAANAPSAGNQQPWHFVVITERALLGKIGSAHPHAKMVPSAAFAIAVCLDASPKRYPLLAHDDCAAATQNILLAAHALGYGAVWVGVHHDPALDHKIKALLHMPEDAKVFSIVPVGVPDEFRETKVRLKDGMVHENRW